MPTGAPSVTGPSSSRPGDGRHPDVVIELDHREPTADGKPPARAGRRIKAALVALLSLVTLSAAAPREPGLTEVTELGERNVTAVALRPDAVVVASADQPVGTTTVQRYALAGDRATAGWSTAIAGGVDELSIRDSPGPGGAVVVGHSFAGDGITVLDGATGALLWTMANANVLQVFDDGVLLLPRSVDGADGTRLRMVTLRTGATRWTRDDEVGTWQFDTGFTVEAEPTNLVTIGEDGRVATYGLDDSRLVVRADLGFRLTREEIDYQRDFTTATVIDRVLYLARRSGGRTSLAAYPVLTLRKAWETTGGPVGELNDCGPYLCVGDRASVHALDPVDGRVLWNDTRWSYVYSDVAGPAAGTGGLLASTRDALPRTVLLDPATGKIRRELGPGTLLGGSSTLFLRTDDVGRTAQIMTVDRTDGTIRVLGDAGAVTPHRCRAAGDYLTCPSVGGPTRIWHLPPR